MRERLIELIKEVKYTPFKDGCGLDVSVEHQLPDHAFEAIADRLLAEGVVVPICKVGDKVYQTDGIRIYESTIREITYCTNNVLIYDTEKVCFDKTAIHKSIFLTKEEAEQALAEREGER